MLKPSSGTLPTATTATGASVDAAITKGRRSASQTRAFLEVGRAGYRRFGGHVYEEFLTELRGRSGIAIYREMRDNDPIIGAAMYAIEQVIARATWTIKPQGSTSLDKEGANFLKSCMNDMEHSWTDFISEILTMLTYGWVFFETVYKIRKGDNRNPELRSRENDGLIGWRKHARRVQSSFYEWNFDEDTGDLIAFSQMSWPDSKVRVIPIEKGLLFRTKYAGDNPEGRSILRNAYKPYYFKKNIEDIEAIGIERDLVGLPVFTPPDGFDIDAEENREVAAAIQTMIANMRRDEQEGILIPFGWDVKLLQIGASRRQFDVDKIVNRYDKRIAATVLAQFIMLGMDRVGSFALSKDQNDLFLVAVQAILGQVASHMNRVAVPRLFELNSGKFAGLRGKYPVLVPAKVTDPNLADLSNYVSRLAGKGFLLPKRRILDTLEELAGLSNRDVDSAGEIEITGEGEELVEAPMLPGVRRDAETELAVTDAKIKGQKEAAKITARQAAASAALAAKKTPPQTGKVGGKPPESEGAEEEEGIKIDDPDDE